VSVVFATAQSVILHPFGVTVLGAKISPIRNRSSLPEFHAAVLTYYFNASDALSVSLCVVGLHPMSAARCVIAPIPRTLVLPARKPRPFQRRLHRPKAFMICCLRPNIRVGRREVFGLRHAPQLFGELPEPLNHQLLQRLHVVMSAIMDAERGAGFARPFARRAVVWALIYHGGVFCQTLAVYLAMVDLHPTRRIKRLPTPIPRTLVLLARALAGTTHRPTPYRLWAVSMSTISVTWTAFSLSTMS